MVQAGISVDNEVISLRHQQEKYKLSSKHFSGILISFLGTRPQKYWEKNDIITSWFTACNGYLHQSCTSLSQPNMFMLRPKCTNDKSWYMYARSPRPWVLLAGQIQVRKCMIDVCMWFNQNMWQFFPYFPALSFKISEHVAFHSTVRIHQGPEMTALCHHNV